MVSDILTKDPWTQNIHLQISSIGVQAITMVTMVTMITMETMAIKAGVTVQSGR